ncbi:MAG: PAS domain S-box protein [Bacillota bacterium]
MTLRKKTAVIIVITLTSLLFILYAMSKVVLLGSFAELEKKDTSKNVERALDAISNNISTLSSEAADWAAWDDTCAFVEGNDYEYVKKNLPDETYSDLKINVIMFFDSSGRLVFSRGFDLVNKVEAPVAESLKNHTKENSHLITHTSPSSSVSGIIVLPEGALMVASRPILTSEREGPVRGSLIMGRYLDSREMWHLSETTHLSVTVLAHDDPAVPSHIKKALSQTKDDPPIAVSPSGSQSVIGYTQINDIYGNHGIILKADMPRDIYRQGQASVVYFITYLLLAGVVFGIVTLLLLEKTVLSRLARFSKGIIAIGSTSDHKARLEVTGKDELSRLGESVNNMLEALDQSRRELAKSEERYRSLVENSPDLIFSLNINGEVETVSQAGLEQFGYSTAEEVIGKHFTDFIHPEDREMATQVLHTLIETKTEVIKGFNFRMINKNGVTIYVEENSVLLFDKSGHYQGLFGTIRDVTDRRLVEEELNLQRAYFQQLFESSPAGIAMADAGDRIITVNRGFEQLFDYTAEEVKGLLINEVIVPENLLGEASAYSNMVVAGNAVHAETLRKRKDGSLVNVSIMAYPIILGEKQVGIYAIYSDITERKQAEDRLKYLSLHDTLTGLYNRAYFEQEMKRIEGARQESAGIILCDVDGLKLVNDTMGHDTGDALLIAAARIIKEAFRSCDMVARIGGDEFAVLLPGSDKNSVQKAAERIRDVIARYNTENSELPLSISIGYAAGEMRSKSMSDLFKEADNNMYREKLLHSQSTRSAVVQTLMKAMEARDFITEGHADRLQDLVSELAKAIGLPERKITDLRLLAQFHDIGKVGIPDRILFKPGPLNGEEFREMLRHSEIGHRIAQSAPALAPIADWILKHHEWWNGKGYPLGLKGEEIPLECRILAIADAYDAMTNNRPYRKAMTHQEAVNELMRCSGSQFDPQLISMFILVLELQNLKKQTGEDRSL